MIWRVSWPAPRCVLLLFLGTRCFDFSPATASSVGGEERVPARTSSLETRAPPHSLNVSSTDPPFFFFPLFFSRTQLYLASPFTSAHPPLFTQAEAPQPHSAAADCSTSGPADDYDSTCRSAAPKIPRYSRLFLVQVDVGRLLAPRFVWRRKWSAG